VVGVAENLVSGAGVLGVLLQLSKLANASVIKAIAITIFTIAVCQLFILYLGFQRRTGARLTLASGVASRDVNIVPFGQCIPTLGRGDGESHSVVAVFAIDMAWILLGAIDAAIVVEVPGPGGYITC